MNNLMIFTRRLPNMNKFAFKYMMPSQELLFSSKSSDVDNEENIPKDEKETKKTPANKLNDLLKKMVEEDVQISKSRIVLAKPTNKRKSKIDTETIKVESEESKLVNAVKEVAATVGGDVKKVESELLQKLMNPAEDTNTAIISNLSEIVKGMKVDTAPVVERSKSSNVRSVLHDFQKNVFARKSRRRATQDIGNDLIPEKIDLFGSEPLGIFGPDVKTYNEGVQNETWNKLYAKELKLAVTHPPSNYFQEMILLTEQGKVWKFPIDNEQGLESEHNIYFVEHVFLEKHLEPWCPQKGPLRHFMELVCTGLSKNPYLTVEAKQKHIEWFKNYFEEKKQLLQEVGAMQDSSSDSLLIDK